MTSDRNYWERHARRYDAPLRLRLGRSGPRMVQLTAAGGCKRVLEAAAGTGVLTTAVAPSVRSQVTLRRPVPRNLLATVVIGGVITSTPLTFFVLPALYLVFEGPNPRIGGPPSGAASPSPPDRGIISA